MKLNVNTSNGSYLCIIFCHTKPTLKNIDNPMLTVLLPFPKASKPLDWKPLAQRSCWDVHPFPKPFDASSNGLPSQLGVKACFEDRDPKSPHVD